MCSPNEQDEQNFNELENVVKSKCVDKGSVVQAL